MPRALAQHGQKTGKRRKQARLSLLSALHSSCKALALLLPHIFILASAAADMSLSPTKTVQNTSRKGISSRAVTGGQQSTVRRALCCCKSVANNTGAGQPRCEPLAASVAQSLGLEAPLHPRVAADRPGSPAVVEVGRWQQQQRHEHFQPPVWLGQPAASVCRFSSYRTTIACGVWHRSLYPSATSVSYVLVVGTTPPQLLCVCPFLLQEFDVLGLGQLMIDYAAAVDEDTLAALDVPKGGRR